MAAQTSNINVNPKIFEREYLHILTRMNPCGQSDIIDRYVEEATNYETNTPLKEARDKSFQPIEHKFIQILDGVLNNGEVPLDVAFCRLIIILPYAQRCSNYSAQFIGSFVYFILGSCFPSLRQKIDLNPQSKVVRYLIETYFPNLNDTRCIKFKYAGHKSTRAILSALEEYMITSVASIICDYVQYPHHEFIHFMNNFVWHLPLYRDLHQCVAESINFMHRFDESTDTTHGHFLSRLLISDYFTDHQDERLKYEAHRMALMKTGDDVTWYLNEIPNKSIRCYVNPRLFVELFEFAVHNPWQVLRDAVVNHSLSIFFNGNEEEKDVVQSHDEMNQMIANVPYIFENIIDVYFDTNDMALVRNVWYQFRNFRSYFTRRARGR
eukprot:1162945_1